MQSQRFIATLIASIMVPYNKDALHCDCISIGIVDRHRHRIARLGERSRRDTTTSTDRRGCDGSSEGLRGSE